MIYTIGGSKTMKNVIDQINILRSNTLTEKDLLDQYTLRVEDWLDKYIIKKPKGIGGKNENN